MSQRIKDYWLVTTSVDYADGAGAFVVGEIPAKTLVLHSAVLVTTAWTGTSPTLDLGDEDNDDAFVDNADVTEGTAAAYISCAGADAGSTSKHGAYYSAQKNIILTIGGTDLTTGVAYGLLHCLDLSNSV